MEHVDIRHLIIFVVVLYPILTALTIRWVLDKRYQRR